MINPNSCRLFVVFLIGVLALSLTGCGGGGGNSSALGPVTISGTGSVSGSVSTAAMANIRAFTLEVSSPAANKDVTIGYYDKNGQFVGVKTGKTDDKGRYTFTGVPDNRKNYIVRADMGNGESFECVVPEVVKDGSVKAPVMDPNSKALAFIILEAARSGYAEKINPAEILSRIPPSAIAGMKNSPADLRTVAQAFVEREKAMDQLGAGIGFDKINELRRYGFEQSRTIMAGIEEGLYSREDGWKLFDEMMTLKIKAMGLGPDALMLIQQIDQKHILEPISDINNPGFDNDEFKRKIEEQKSVQSIEKLIEALKFFLTEGYITQADFDAVNDFLMNTKEDVERAQDAEMMKGLMAPAVPRIGYLIDKIIEKSGLRMGNPPKILAVMQAMNPPQIMIFPPPPVDFAAISRNVMSALKVALPNASTTMLENLFIVLQTPVHAFGATPPEPPTGIEPVPGFADGFAASQIGGIIKQVGNPFNFENRQVSYLVEAPAIQNRPQMIIAFILVKDGVAINPAGLIGKWVELKGKFIRIKTTPDGDPPVFEIDELLKQSDNAPVEPPAEREMRFTGVLRKTEAGSYFIGDAAQPLKQIVVDASAVASRDDFIGKFVIITGTVTQWATGGGVPARIKATGITLNTTSGLVVNN